MRQTSEPRKKLSKAELVQVLTGKVEKWIAEGIPPEEAVGRLTDKQYDFLIDQDVDLDKYLLTADQIKEKAMGYFNKAVQRKGVDTSKPFKSEGPEDQTRDWKKERERQEARQGIKHEKK